MDFGIFFSKAAKNAQLDLIFSIGIALLFVTLFLFSLILLLRVSLLRKNQQKQSLVERWMPILETGMNRDFPDVVPTLKQEELSTFLALWLNLYESSDESSREILVMIALQAGLETCLNQQLKPGNPVRQKILLLSTIGALKAATHWDVCLHDLHSENAFLSLAAARALLQINPEAALPQVLETLAQRSDWPSARVSVILMEVGIQRISEPLAALVRAASFEELPRLIPYLKIISGNVAVPLLQTLMSESERQQNEDVLLACLQVLGGFSRFAQADTIIHCLEHPNPFIRAEAAIVLSRTGSFSDGKYIVGMLNDDTPLVQYKAAQALMNLPTMTEPKLLALQQRLENPNAVAMLNRVMSERRFQR